MQKLHAISRKETGSYVFELKKKPLFFSPSLSSQHFESIFFSIFVSKPPRSLAPPPQPKNAQSLERERESPLRLIFQFCPSISTPFYENAPPQCPAQPLRRDSKDKGKTGKLPAAVLTMSVRTYGRRNASRGIPYSDSLNDAVHDSEDTLSSQEHHHHHHHLYGPFSSQESSASAAFDFDPYGFDSSSQVSFDDDSLTDGGFRKPKKTRVVPEKRDLPPPAPPPSKRRNSSRPPLIPATATLMEAQEFGEMMEHVDEVNFALDGLRRNQPVRIRRASLLSLLSICGTAQQRRLLRTQG